MNISEKRRTTNKHYFTHGRKTIILPNMRTVRKPRKEHELRRYGYLPCVQVVSCGKKEKKGIL